MDTSYLVAMAMLIAFAVNLILFFAGSAESLPGLFCCSRLDLVPQNQTKELWRDVRCA